MHHPFQCVEASARCMQLPESSVKWQTDKMDEAGRVLSPLQLGLPWRPSRPTSPFHRLPRTTSSQVLSISTDGDSTDSLGNLCQCLTTLTRKKCFLVFRWNFVCFNLCPVPLAPSVGTPEKCLAPSSLPLKLCRTWQI